MIELKGLKTKDKQPGDMATRQGKKSSRKLQLSIFSFLDTRSTSASLWYHRTVVTLVIISLIFAIVYTVDGYNVEPVYIASIILEWILLIIFITEHGLRIWASGGHGIYGARGGLKTYLLKAHMIIDTIAILSSIALVFTLHLRIAVEDQRFLYLLQLLRTLRIDRQRDAFLAFWKVFRRHRKELLTSWYMGFLMVVFVSFLVYALDKKSDKNDDDLFNSVYWGVISLTTIGYGDISPETTIGKLLICWFAIFGTCFLAMPAGIIGSGFALQVAEQQKEKHANRRRRPAAIILQSYWRKFAADNDLAATWVPHIKGRAEKYQKDKQELGMTGLLPRKILSNCELKCDLTDEEINGNALWFPRQTLTPPEKIALRFIRFLKCISASKNFKQARRPYDERDILDQFASSQVEVFARLKEIKFKMDSALKLQEEKLVTAMTTIASLENRVGHQSTQIVENNRLLNELLNKLNDGTEKDSEA